MKLPLSYYQTDDVVGLSRDFLGKVLCTHIGDQLTSGIITETEAYRGPDDRASHAFGGRRTARTEVMYSPGGVAYVYLCYGIHHLFNIVTSRASTPHAILIRSIAPLEGLQAMQKRRQKKAWSPKMTQGPGSLAQALGITTQHTGISLSESTIWLEDRRLAVPAGAITATPRIGIDYAGEDAALPWRFVFDQPPSLE